MEGFGSMIAFEVHGGAGAAEAAAGSTQLIVHATSLGGIESSMERRAKWPGEDAPPSLLRLSVGCEDVEDLWADLDHALVVAAKVARGLRTAVGLPTSRGAVGNAELRCARAAQPHALVRTEYSSNESSNKSVLHLTCAATWPSMPWRWPSTPGELPDSTDWCVAATAPVQYLSIRYTERLSEVGVVNSMGSRGDSYDNAMAESFNGLYKTELIFHEGPWRGVEEVEWATLSYVDWFNHRRIHNEIGKIPPAELEANCYYYRQGATERAPARPSGTAGFVGRKR